MSTDTTSLSIFLRAMTKEELFQWMDMAERDLKEAAEKEHDSDWHVACFAALYALCQESSRRGLKRHHTH